jgi:hypothetical protein
MERDCLSFQKTANIPADTAAFIPGPSDRLQLRHLEKTGGWTRPERLRILWYRLFLTMQTRLP